MIHFQSENGTALTAQLDHHQVHALAFTRRRRPGMYTSRPATDGTTPSSTPQAKKRRPSRSARANGTAVAVAVAKPKAAAKPAHHTLRYVAAGILVLVTS